jgi:dTDP-4-dehydrorhamnose 3,5-epimerase
MGIDRPRVIDIPLHVDDRGSVYGAFDELDKAGIRRTYVVRNWQCETIRAWHGHMKAGTYIHPIKGTAKIAALEISLDGERDFLVSTLSAAKPQLFYIPPGWYNGTMTLQEDTRLLVYSTLTLAEVKSDDMRKEVTDQELKDIWKVKNR